ncbi:winged helix-turn-helix transcriptional regulator [Acinetobacter bereziniae]|uniref:winged helix-turn-helix transcriptional regulator n=1 Tax=Acinetobacter bereziniae TaxID=106648 RepID=UPI001901A0B9|nr:helix-turn-helix domain-containing protein [Acinetobacter bereziniae]MBJ8554770.1 helix-turn-helix transcriptional regulator [Acinetobacter bereziniae]
MSTKLSPIYRADCPSRTILDQITDKWSMLILMVLDEPHRFNAIKRRLDGITQRVLTQTLRKLERNGMVTRTVIDGKILGVEYALTPLGQSLKAPFNALYDWTVENMEMIQAYQSDYDSSDKSVIK